MKYAGEVLIHPVVRGEKLSEVGIPELRQFAEKAKYTAMVLNAFRRCFDDRMSETSVRREIDRFSQTEVKFPPSEKDPFFTG